MSASAELVLGAVHGHGSESCCSVNGHLRASIEPVMTAQRKPSEMTRADMVFVWLQGHSPTGLHVVPGYMKLLGREGWE